MNQRNAERRPGLTFQQVDATKTPYEDGSYQAALDKGTLDAMAAEEDGALARNMLTEVGNLVGNSVCSIEVCSVHNRAVPSHVSRLEECCV